MIAVTLVPGGFPVSILSDFLHRRNHVICEHFYFFLPYMYLFYFLDLLHSLDPLTRRWRAVRGSILPCIGSCGRVEFLTRKCDVGCGVVWITSATLWEFSSVPNSESLPWMGVGFCQMLNLYLLMWSHDFSFLSLLVWKIKLIDFWILNQPCTPGTNPT